MAVNGINNYRDTLYQWQNQQLKQTGSSASSSTSGLISSLFGGSTSMVSQINSMVELTKYAMDQMGLASDSRVTFSQISKYREQLQSEFNAGVKEGLAASGISDVSALSFALDKNGKITAIGENGSDRKAAQAWLDANPSYGLEILKNLPADAFEERSEIEFHISSTGALTAVNSEQQRLQQLLNQNGDLAENMRSRLKAAGLEVKWPVELDFDEEGSLRVKGDDGQAAELNAWLKTSTEVETEIKKLLEKQKVATAAVELRLGESGAFQASVNNATVNDIQSGLDEAKAIGEKLASGLKNLGIDKNISFSIQIDANGKFTVVSDHPDAAKLQQFFDNNPELVKKYQQIEALAGIDDARKAMQISPAAMRKRVQIESMAAWWTNSSDSSSYFGQYSGANGLSLLSGLNLTV